MKTTTAVSSDFIKFMEGMYGHEAVMHLLSGNEDEQLRNYALSELAKLKGERSQIATAEFDITQLSTDVHTIADGFGFNQENLEFVGADDNETFQKILDVLDMALSAALVIPVDKIDEMKSGIKTVAQALKKYVPNFRTIGSLLSMAPGIAKYSNALISFGESMDSAIDIINRDEKDSIRKAIKEMRSAIDLMRDVDIMDINDQVKKAKVKKEDIIEVEVTDVKDADKSVPKQEKKEEKKAKKEEKKSEVIQGKTEDTVAGAAAMTQQMMPGMMPGFIPDNDGSIPSWMDTNVSKDPTRSVPEFIGQNDMTIPRVDVQQRIFAPVQQKQPAYYVDQRLANYPFVPELQKLANSVGIMITAELIVNLDNQPSLIFIRAYNQNAYIQDKSFIIDLGTVIDGRIGIWPCASANGNYEVLEKCNEVYRLYESDKQDSKINDDFITEIFKYGFNNIRDDVKKKNILYGERMCEANRIFSMISIPNSSLDKETRNIIRGAFIRMAPHFRDAGYASVGKLRVVSVNPKTLEVKLTNEGSSLYFMTPAYPHAPFEITLRPAKDEEGNYIPAGNKKGSDIKFDVLVNTSNTQQQ